MKKQRLYEFDLIKLIAMLAVFTIHFTKELEAAGVSAAVKVLPDNVFHVYLGSFGVSLFFIASGASLWYVYENSCKPGPYYKKRFLALYPMFWIAFLVATGFNFLRYQGLSDSIPKWKIIYSILGIDGTALWYGPNFYQLGEWFLGVIICLYLVFPLIRFCLKKSVLVTVAGSAAIFVSCILFFQATLPIECLFLVRIPEFLFGMLFIKFRHKFKVWHLFPALLGIGIICALPMESVHVMIRNLVVGMGSFTILAWLFKKIPYKGIVRYLCSWGGKYSYAFFLTHHVVILFLASRFAGSDLRRSEVYLLYLCCLGITALTTRLLFVLHKSFINLFKREEIL